jgi:hypothetical protein
LLPDVLCAKKTLDRKTRSDGYPEGIQAWLKRKTCGKYLDENGFYKRTDCFNKYITGEGNPNFRGKLPTCKVCGKKVSYYAHDKKVSQYCKEHWMEHARKTGHFERTGKRLLEMGYGFKKGQRVLGVSFEKGHKTWNKGKTYEELYGETKSNLIKDILRMAMKHTRELGKL